MTSTVVLFEMPDWLDQLRVNRRVTHFAVKPLAMTELSKQDATHAAIILRRTHRVPCMLQSFLLCIRIFTSFSSFMK